MKSYLKYLIKKRFPIYLSAFVIFMILFFSVNNVGSMLLSKDFNGEQVEYVSHDIFLVYIISFAIALGVIVPFEFSFKMKNITANQAYSLPMKREILYWTRFLFGFLEVLVPFTLAFGISILSLFPIYPHVNMLGFLVLYGLLVIVGFLFYSIEVFVYCQANNVVDGIVFILLASVLPFAVSFAVLYTVTGSNSALYPINPRSYFPEFNFSIPNDIAKLVLYHNHVYQWKLTTVFVDKEYVVYTPVSYELSITTEYVVSMCIFVVWGIASFIGQFFVSKSFKSEDAGQRSESWFGYKTYIPVILISFCYIIGNGSIVLYFICLISIYLLYVLYKRSFKLDKKTWIIVACVLIAATVAYVMGMGFSLEDTLRKNYLNPRYDDYYAKVLLNCVSNRMLL